MSRKRFYEKVLYLEHTKNVIDFEKKKMLPLTKEELKSDQNAKVCYIWGKKIFKKFAKGKNYGNVRNHCHYTSKYTGTANSIYNLKLNVPNKIPIVFYNDSNYDYHFSIKELSNGFEGQFECRAENKEKYKTFSVLIKLFQEIKKYIKIVTKVLSIYHAT